MRPGIAPPKPIPIRERASAIFVEKGRLDVLDGAFVMVDKEGIRTHIPVGGITCLMLEPGVRVSHAAVVLSARVGCLLLWVGEAGVRMYATGQPGGAHADRLLYQARLAIDDVARLKVVRKMYELRFKEKPPDSHTCDQLRGIEGARVKQMYKNLAKKYGVSWSSRRYIPDDWEEADLANRCLSQATSCLYGITEAAILAAGYAPAIGFLHTGKPQSFVYDIADIFKFDTVVPIAFRIAGETKKRRKGVIDDHIARVRHECRDSFRKTRLLSHIVPLIDEIMVAGELEMSVPNPEAQPVAITEKPSGDVGHRG